MKIVAALVTEGLAAGERGLDIRGVMTHLLTHLPMLIDTLHATVIVDLNPQDAGRVFPVEVCLTDPNGSIVAEGRTRTSFAPGVLGALAIATFPLGSVMLDTPGPHLIEVTIGSASSSVAFDLIHEVDSSANMGGPARPG